MTNGENKGLLCREWLGGSAGNGGIIRISKWGNVMHINENSFREAADIRTESSKSYLQFSKYVTKYSSDVLTRK